MSPRQWRFRFPWWWHAIWLLGLVAASFVVLAVAMTFVFIHRLTGDMGPTLAETQTPTVWEVVRTGLTGLGFLVSWVSVAGRLVFDVLLVRRGRVRADDQGLSVTDGWGTTRSLGWGDVRELRVLPRGRGTPEGVFSPVLRIGGADRILHVPSGLQGTEGLVETIIARAGLSRQEKAGRGTKYLRPETED